VQSSDAAAPPLGDEASDEASNERQSSADLSGSFGDLMARRMLTRRLKPRRILGYLTLASLALVIAGAGVVSLRPREPARTHTPVGDTPARVTPSAAPVLTVRDNLPVPARAPEYVAASPSIASVPVGVTSTAPPRSDRATWRTSRERRAKPNLGQITTLNPYR
jgi:hypothetical protein